MNKEVMLKRIGGIIIILAYILLFIFGILNNIIMLLPLAFEIFILALSGFRYTHNKDVEFESITILKNIVLLITLILSLFKINILILKIMLSLAIVLQVMTFLTINKSPIIKKLRKIKRV